MPDSKIPVAWWPQPCQGGVVRAALIELAFPLPWAEHVALLAGDEGGVVVLVGEAMASADLDMRAFNEQTRKLKWLLIISIADEGSSIQLDRIEHPNASVWVQESKPGLCAGSLGVMGTGQANHDKFHRIPLGASPFCNRLLPLFSEERKKKPLDWFFAGAVRDTVIGRAWIDAIRALPGKSSIGLGASDYAVPYNYMRGFASAKVIPCRPGMCTAESPRVYEALESGCVPVAGTYPVGDGWAARYDWPRHWEYLLGEKPPFPVISGPEHLAAAVHETLSNWQERAEVCQAWWADYKQRLVKSLQEDAARLKQLVG